MKFYFVIVTAAREDCWWNQIWEIKRNMIGFSSIYDLSNQYMLHTITTTWGSTNTLSHFLKSCPPFLHPWSMPCSSAGVHSRFTSKIAVMYYLCNTYTRLDSIYHSTRGYMYMYTSKNKWAIRQLPSLLHLLYKTHKTFQFFQKEKK